MSLRVTGRGAGKTTSQLRAAPLGAVYIVPTKGAISYTKALAASLGRTDLEIVSPTWVEGSRGRPRQIAADHATWSYLSRQQSEDLAYLLARERAAFPHKT